MSAYAFGIDSNLQFPDESAVEDYGVPSAKDLADVCQLTRDALQLPQGFPPLREIVVPGDLVAIALEDGLVQAAEVVAGIVAELQNAGITPNAITIVRSQQEANVSQADPTQRLPAEVRTQVQLVEHDPLNRERLSYLGTSDDDRPIYMCREIVDADVVLPVGVIRDSESLGYMGVHGTVYPMFADEAAQQRYYAPDSVQSEEELQGRRTEAREANWHLGVRLTVQLIPGIGEQVLSVLAGDAEVINELGGEACRQIWRFNVPQRASLVVATIPGGRPQQTWSSVARALDAALRVVDDDGAIAVCCGLKTKPGPALKRLRRADSLDELGQVVQKDRTPDAVAANRLVRALQRVRVYLLSELDEDVVESLGMAYVSDPTEIVRLATHHDSCILLQNAHHAVPMITAEAI